MSASMANLVRNPVKFIQCLQKNLPVLGSYGEMFFHQPVRFYGSKHYDPHSRKFRKLKQLNMKNLPDRDEQTKKKTPDDVRIFMKKHGILPKKPDIQRIDISCTNSVTDEFLPPEGDGKASLMSTKRGKDVVQSSVSKGKNVVNRRKLKKYDETFTDKTFTELAQSILIKTYALLQDVQYNEDELHTLVTNNAYPNMVFGLRYKTFRWKFIESLEPPQIVHIRTSTMLTDDNMYSQVTVRFHTKQMLSVYDRFGRLMYGSETVPRDVLEYVVFEKHIVNVYGEWRIHGKITPDWLSSTTPLHTTLVKPDLPDDKELQEQIKAAAEADHDDEEEAGDVKASSS